MPPPAAGTGPPTLTAALALASAPAAARCHTVCRKRRDGDSYKGGSVNILTILVAISILTPLAGLIFAYNTFGVLWG